MEANYIANVSLHKDNLIGKWGGSLNMFGQIMTNKFNNNYIQATLDVPNYFSVTNALDNKPDVGQSLSQKQVNSAFATLDIDYDDFWFINATARNDWSSTMSKDNRSYFYPSVSSSLVVTDMFRKLWGTRPFGDVINFAKIRGSYAITGNSLEPYQLINTYGIGHDLQGNINASVGDVLYNENVRSEMLTTFEAGANFRLFNFLDLDVNYYDTHAKRQLLNLPMNPFSGNSGKKINAGDIQNKGWEITLGADLIQNEDFAWNLDLNFSKNTNKILEFTEGVDYYPFLDLDNLHIGAEVGERYGVIRGTRFARVEDESSEHYGKKILDDDGLPIADDGEDHLLGDQTPRANLGITNSFVLFKNFAFSFQVDGRFGGKFFSGTKKGMKHWGLAQETVVDGERNDFVADGVIADGDDYIANENEVSPQEYWKAVSERSGNLGINEENIFDATNVRLRNVQLTYNFPQSILANTPLQRAKLSFSVNNAWMIYSAENGLDPESVYATGSNATGYEFFSYPTSREFIFNLTVGF